MAKKIFLTGKNDNPEDPFSQRFGDQMVGQLQHDFDTNGSLFHRQTKKEPTNYKKSTMTKAQVVTEGKNDDYDVEEEYDNENEE